MVFNRIVSSPIFSTNDTHHLKRTLGSEPLNLCDKGLVTPMEISEDDSSSHSTRTPNDSTGDTTKPEFYMGDDYSSSSRTSSIHSFDSIEQNQTSFKNYEEQQVTSADFVPPDGGFGWVISISACIVNIFIVGFIRSYGVLYVAIMQKFPEASAYQASWLPVFLSTIGLLIAPITGILCRKFTSRRVSFFGGFLIFVGLLWGAFARSIFEMIFSVGLLTGIGTGLTTIPGILITSLYFVRRRSLASAICISGNAIGGLIFPPLLEYLLESFTFEGALSIMAVLQLHICAASLLFRPITVHALIQQKAKRKHMYFPKEEDEISCMMKDDKADLSKFLPDRLLHVPTPQNIELQRHVSLLRSSSLLSSIPDLTEYARSWSLDRGCLRGQTYLSHNGNNLCSKPIDSSKELAKSFTYDEDYDGHLYEKKYHLNFSRECLPETEYAKYLVNHKEPKDKPLILLTSTNGNTVNIKESNVDNLDVPRQNTDIPNKPNSSCKKLFDFSVLSNSLFWLVAISITLVSSGAPHAMFFMPAYAESVNIERSATVYLLCIISVIDLFARFGIGFLSDSNIIPLAYIYAISSIGAGISLLVLPSMTSFIGIAVSLGVYGVGVGGWFVLIPTILAENHGIEKLAASYGLAKMFNGFMNFVTPQICGVIIDVTGAYNQIYYYMGILMTLGGLLMFFEPYLISRNKSKIENFSSA